MLTPTQTATESPATTRTSHVTTDRPAEFTSMATTTSAAATRATGSHPGAGSSNKVKIRWLTEQAK